MNDRERKLPYIIGRLDSRGGAWPQPERSTAAAHRTVGQLDRDALTDDGWIGEKRRRRWYVDAARPNYGPVIVRRDKLNDIHVLEALRWRTMLHVREHHNPRYDAAVARLRDVEDPRLVRGDRVYRLVFHRSDTYPTEEEVKLKDDAGIVERVGHIPTPEDDGFRAGAVFQFESSAIHSAFFRVGRCNDALLCALQLYISRHFPQIERSRVEMRPSVIFTINGRSYPIAGDDRKQDHRWLTLEDIVIDLDKERGVGPSG